MYENNNDDISEENFGTMEKMSNPFPRHPSRSRDNPISRYYAYKGYNESNIILILYIVHCKCDS